MRVYHVGLLAICAALWTTPADGQTMFAWADTAVNVAAYTTVEECQAAIERTIDYTDAQADLASGIWTDTVPLDSAEALESRALHAPVTATARLCGARFANADSVPLAYFAPLVTLYLQAEWDDKARALIERRLAGIGPRDDTQRAAVLDTALELLRSRGNNPIGRNRPDIAYDIVVRHLPKVADRVKRLRLYSGLDKFIPAGTHPDTARAAAMKFAAEMTSIVDSLTPRELDELLSRYGAFGEGIEDADDFVQRYYALLNMSLGKRAVLDSLRRSTDTYVKVMKANWSQATGMREEAYRFGNPLGGKAPPIEADIWLGHDPAKGPRPAPGRVSLVVFLNSHECNGAITASELYANCARSLNPLARLEGRFPDLDITVVAESHGYFLYLKDSITPEKEAELTKRWLETHGVDAPLAMTTSSSWRLPDPDRRRLSRPTANRTNYSFGGKRPVLNSAAFLIDPRGIVVHSRQMNRFATFQDYNELIEILLERQRKPGQVVP